MFEDNILLRLRRQYSKDEAVAFLSAKLKERDFRIGELTSEVEELKHLFSKEQKKKQQVKEIHIEPQTKKQWRRDDACKEFTKEIETQKAKIIQLNNDVKFWRDKYFTLKNPILTADIRNYDPMYYVHREEDFKALNPTKVDPPFQWIPVPKFR